MLFSQPVPRDTRAPKRLRSHPKMLQPRSPSTAPFLPWYTGTRGRTLGKGKKNPPSAQTAHSALCERIKIAGRRAGPEYQAAFPARCSTARARENPNQLPLHSVLLEAARCLNFLFLINTASGDVALGSCRLAHPPSSLWQPPTSLWKELLTSRGVRTGWGGGFCEYSTPLHSRPAYY